MKLAIICFSFFLLLSGCQNKPEQFIKAYEKSENSIHISRFISIDSFKAFYARDSILILDAEFELASEQRIQALQMQLDERVLNRQKAETDLLSSQNPLMKKAVANRIQIIEHEEEILNKILALYTNHPEKTQLNSFIKERMLYAEFPDSILAYSLKASFKGSIGKLAAEKFDRTYLFSADKSTIIGLLQP